MLIDASFGFEMETFEFLNICQVHGFPRIMGVLTHLDSFKNNKTLRKTKKNLKHRFWTEVYQVDTTLAFCFIGQKHTQSDSWRRSRLSTGYCDWCKNWVHVVCETCRVPSSSICLGWCTGSIRLRKWRTSAASSLSWSFVLWCGRPPTLMCWLTGESQPETTWNTSHLFNLLFELYLLFYEDVECNINSTFSCSIVGFVQLIYIKGRPSKYFIPWNFENSLCSQG